MTKRSNIHPGIVRRRPSDAVAVTHANRRRGASMLLVMFSVTVAAVTGMAFLSQQSTSTAIARNLTNQVTARSIAESVMHQTLASLESNPDWRRTKPHGLWADRQSMEGGEVTVQVQDIADVAETGERGDGDLTDNPADPIRITVRASYQGVSHRVTAEVTPQATIGRRAMLLVGDASRLTTGEAQRRARFEQWGFEVTPATGRESAAAFDEMLGSVDVIYVCDSASPLSVARKLRAASIGIVTEHAKLAEALGLADATYATTFTGVDIVNTEHHVTQPMNTGFLGLFHQGQSQPGHATRQGPNKNKEKEKEKEKEKRKDKANDEGKDKDNGRQKDKNSKQRSAAPLELIDVLCIEQATNHTGPAIDMSAEYCSFGHNGHNKWKTKGGKFDRRGSSRDGRTSDDPIGTILAVRATTTASTQGTSARGNAYGHLVGRGYGNDDRFTGRFTCKRKKEKVDTTGDPTVLVIDAGNYLHTSRGDAQLAPARRVLMPWGGVRFDFGAVNQNGLTLMRRAVEWATGQVQGDDSIQPTVVALDAIQLSGRQCYILPWDSRVLRASSNSRSRYSKGRSSRSSSRNRSGCQRYYDIWEVSPGSGLVVASNTTRQGQVQLQQGATIYGDLRIGPGGDVRRVVRVDRQSDITGETDKLAAQWPSEAITVPSVNPKLPATRSGNRTTTISADRRYAGWSLSGQAVIRITQDVDIVVSGKFEMTGNATIEVAEGAQLNLYLEQGGTVGGDARINAEDTDPDRLNVFLPGRQTLTLRNTTVVCGEVRAPRGSLRIDHQSQLFGRFFGSSLRMTDRARLYADTRLPGTPVQDGSGRPGVTAYRYKARWLEMNTADPRATVARKTATAIIPQLLEQR